MPDPLVVQIMREHKAAILAQEEAAMQEMAARWLMIEKALQAEMETLAMEVALMAANGQVINKAVIIRLERMQKLLFQIRAQTGQYAQWADEAISGWQSTLAGLGLTDAADGIMSVLSEFQIVAQFDRLNISAVESMIGLAGDGSPLTRYLQAVHPAAADGVMEALINGVAQGIHPIKIAQEMANGLGMGLQQAMNTARTETLRAYRNACLMQYDASGLVVGYKRISARDERVCAGCLFTDGMFVESHSEFEEHNQGRCSMIPVLRDGAEPNWQSPYDWFEGQSATTQESILGPGRFEAWQNGASLESMVTRTEDPIWGGAYVPTQVNQLQVER
jgi:hypothetical protein